MCAIFAYSAQMYIFNYEQIVSYFPNLGFPGWLVAPLAVLKILGIVAVLSKKSRFLKEWAYAGFLFDSLLAFFAHYFAADGQGMIAAVAIVATLVSKVFDEKLYNS